MSQCEHSWRLIKKSAIYTARRPIKVSWRGKVSIDDYHLEYLPLVTGYNYEWYCTKCRTFDHTREDIPGIIEKQLKAGWAVRQGKDWLLPEGVVLS